MAAFWVVKDQLIGYILMANRAGILGTFLKGNTHLIDFLLQRLFLLEFDWKSVLEGVGISLVRSLNDSFKCFFVVIFYPCLKSHLLLRLPQLHLNLQQLCVRASPIVVAFNLHDLFVEIFNLLLEFNVALQVLFVSFLDYLRLSLQLPHFDSQLFYQFFFHHQLYFHVLIFLFYFTGPIFLPLLFFTELLIESFSFLSPLFRVRNLCIECWYIPLQVLYLNKQLFLSVFCFLKPLLPKHQPLIIQFHNLLLKIFLFLSERILQIDNCTFKSTDLFPQCRLTLQLTILWNFQEISWVFAEI